MKVMSLGIEDSESNFGLNEGRVGFTSNYSRANIWLSKETALCYS